MKDIKLYQSDMIEPAWETYVSVFGTHNVLEEKHTDEQYIRLYADTDYEVALGAEAIKDVKRFQSDRLLDIAPFNTEVATANILEELLELNGYDVPKENRESMVKKFDEFMQSMGKNNTMNVASNEEYYKEDALCDIMVFAIGELMKLRHSPQVALLETAKEINSRTGEIINGKFEKDLSPEATAEWYKADYEKSKIKGE